MTEPELHPLQIQALEGAFEAIPGNLRMMAQVYADQASLIKRTVGIVNNALAVADSSGPSVLFDFSNDPLRGLEVHEQLVEIHTRVVDLLIMAALGQQIEMEEFQDYAKTLVPLYASFEFLQKLKGSALKDKAMQELEQEWSAGTDFSRVQHFFKAARAGVSYAANYCKLTIAALPQF